MSGERKTLWSGRFSEGAAESTLLFTTSLAVDQRLARYDILGSLAHARMLTRQGIISAQDGEAIQGGLHSIMAQVEEGTLPVQESLEDIHSNIEFLLTDMVGDAGARLHTARSRNDQVVTDLRMFMRDATLDTLEAISALQKALMERASDSLEIILPGFTHIQHAQPVTVGHWLMAHFFRLQRDAERLVDSYKRLNVCPLGSAALAGTTYKIDRLSTASLLGFDAPCPNSIDGVSDRDFVAEYLFAATLTAVHLSSLCEELVYWSSSEFGFLEMADSYSTGSSIMPQKKNPDVAELIRGRTGASVGDLVNILTTMKGLPTAYNRDLQEDKPAVFAAYDRLIPCLRMAAAMVATMRLNEERMLNACKDGYINATDLADYLVMKGLPFRRAHEVVGAIVRYAIDNRKRLEDLNVYELKGFCGIIDRDVFSVLPVDRCVARRTSIGGTSPEVTPMQLSQAMSVLHRQSEFVDRERTRVERAFATLMS
ncbi:MAG: argininosuccinate lyase [Methanomassiliicoccus sp.]|nr:argininosuccinate lyase [Methanomassiliicoccus sp.]